MVKIKYVVDRIEDGKTVVLVNSSDDSELQLPKNGLCEDLCENDIVYVTTENGSIIAINADKSETEKKRSEMKKKLGSLFDEK